MPVKATYIDFELDWLESKVKALMSYIDNHPLDNLIDRIQTFPSPKGLVVKIISTEEQQLKAYQSVLKDLPPLLKDLDDLRRRKEEAEIKTRGNSKMPGIMRDKLQTPN